MNEILGTPAASAVTRFPASPDEAPAAAAGLEKLWTKDLSVAAGARLAWLWRGYLASGNVTLLTSQWKTGKTTLVSVLLAQLKRGGTLAGLPLAKGKAVVVSEESPALWHQRSERLQFGDDICFMCRPFRGKPRTHEWEALVDEVEQLHCAHGIDLLVIDPLATFMPGNNESNAGCMMDTLMPLQRLTSRGMSVLVMHHPRKAESVPGQAARGSGALTGYVDIIVEMRCANANDSGDRRRRLQAWSRYQETPPQLVIELNQEGNDYIAHGDFLADEFEEKWLQLRAVLEEAVGKKDRKQILDAWPSHWDKPSPAQLWRWLERALERKLVCKHGKGNRHDSFRYWLPGAEKKWEKDPRYVPDFRDEDFDSFKRRLGL